MSNQFTDRKFWINYWQSKPNLAIPIRRNYVFHKRLKDIIAGNNIKTAIELGGFPGYYAVFLRRYFNIKTVLFDYFIDLGILDKVLNKNGLKTTDIEIIEGDIFNYLPEKKYELVLSCGLIEHFEDTRDILSRHVQFLNPGGVLFISLPNFTGLNGWLQRMFDKSNFEKHNIKCMDPALLAGICKELNLQEIRSGYYGKFTVWLENKKEKSIVVNWFVKCIWFLGKSLTTIIPFESKALSPYIILTAKKG